MHKYDVRTRWWPSRPCAYVCVQQYEYKTANHKKKKKKPTRNHFVMLHCLGRMLRKKKSNRITSSCSTNRLGVPLCPIGLSTVGTRRTINGRGKEEKTSLTETTYSRPSWFGKYIILCTRIISLSNSLSLSFSSVSLFLLFLCARVCDTREPVTHRGIQRTRGRRGVPCRRRPFSFRPAEHSPRARRLVNSAECVRDTRRQYDAYGIRRRSRRTIRLRKIIRRVRAKRGKTTRINDFFFLSLSMYLHTGVTVPEDDR